MTNLVFVHGFCENAKLWDDQVAYLNDHFKILAVDLPGFGTESHTPSPDKMYEFANFVFAEMDDKNIGQAVIIGHSLGGYVALEMLNIAPDRILALGLVHSHPFADNEEKKINRKKVIRHIEENGTEVFLKHFKQSLISDANHSNQRITNRIDEVVEGIPTKSVINTSVAMMNRNDYSSNLFKTLKPCLFVLGDADSFFSPSDVLKKECLPYLAQIEILETGHLSMIESPLKLSHILLNFLNWVNTWQE